jgi:hypothetical protein
MSSHELDHEPDDQSPIVANDLTPPDRSPDHQADGQAQAVANDQGPRKVRAGFPPSLIYPLFHATNRYIVLNGGRGGGKSWAIARALLIRAANTPTRVLCVREFMSSIKQSTHKLLCDQIVELGLEDRFLIERSAIYGKNGSEFAFEGIRSNVSGLKSYEGFDIAYCSEGCADTHHSA